MKPQSFIKVSWATWVQSTPSHIISFYMDFNIILWSVYVQKKKGGDALCGNLGRDSCRYSDSLRAGRSRDRIPVGGEVLRTRPDRPWGPHSLLYNGYRVFPGGKAAGEGPWPPTTSNTEVKEKVQLYLYSPSGPSGPVLWQTSPLPLSRNHVWMYFF